MTKIFNTCLTLATLAVPLVALNHLATNTTNQQKTAKHNNSEYTPPSSNINAKYQNLFVLGDSLSDQGNLTQISREWYLLVLLKK